MDQNYDVIVVGGGPGGSTAAAVAAKNGLRTLIVDRADFPRDKTCGDAVGIACFRILREIGYTAFNDIEHYGLNQALIRAPRGGSLKIPLSHEAEFASSIVPRFEFDDLVFKYALSCGAEFEKLTVSGAIVENGQVVGITGKKGDEEFTRRAKVVIAADGATSVIARQLAGTERHDNQTAVAIRGYIETDVDLDRSMELVFLGDIPAGYAWFFPITKRSANIGVGMRSDYYKRQNLSLKQMLDYYANLEIVSKLIGGNKPTKVKSWQLPLYNPNKKRRFNGALLVGDAGDFVDPISGGGIYNAQVTGKAAAEAAITAIKVGDVSAKGLARFDMLWDARIGGDLRRSLTIHKLLTSMPAFMDIMLAIGNAFPPIVPKLIGEF